MKLEAIGKSFTYRWPGGEVHLEPGTPIDLPEERAKRLLAKAGDKVRLMSTEIEGRRKAGGQPGSHRYPKTRKHGPRKLDAAKVLELAAAGISGQDIATHQGVKGAAVYRFLAQHKVHLKAVQTFKTHRADLLAGLQVKTMDVQTRILETLTKDGVIEGMKDQAKTGLLVALNATAGTSFDKERLQRGQSTSNQSIISRMLDETVKNLYRKPKSPEIEDCANKKQDAPDSTT